MSQISDGSWATANPEPQRSRHRSCFVRPCDKDGSFVSSGHDAEIDNLFGKATAADGVRIWSSDRRKLGFIPTPAVASNCAVGGGDGRRLFIAATQYPLAIGLRA
jgi:sugar lactone lactonase YvrE